MFKKTLLLFVLLLFSGCVERGFEVTVNNTTHTVSALKSIDIKGHKKSNTAKDMETMRKAVSKKQKRQNRDNVAKALKKKEIQKRIERQKRAAAKQKKELHQKEIEKRRASLEKRLAEEKKAEEKAAQEERMRLEKKAQEEKSAQDEREKALTLFKKNKEREALEKKLAEERAVREAKAKEEKLALEQKIEKEKALQRKKEQEEKAALERQAEKERQLALEKQNAEKKRKQEIKKAAAEKLQKERETSIQNEKSKKKQQIHTAETLIFKPSTQTYQKFGTSEIHGHVVYLAPGGQEIGLKNTKVYLVPQNSTTDYWYNNYYLKNKESASLSKTTVHYINATHLNLEKNFAFYGLATGTYYVIIESSYPGATDKNKKVYIAKKINVEKYKKIMTVFSKRL